MEFETPQEGGQCPHGYPLHISTECPDCQPEKEESTADMGENIIEEESRQESGQIITGAEKESESSERPAGKSADELKSLYGGEGITSDKDIVAYCRIGERSSHTWFVLTYLLGYPGVRNYDGSWTEWGNLVGMPIER